MMGLELRSVDSDSSELCPVDSGSDEDITPMDTNNTPQVQGPITRARAQ
jgi:hypothetical protein